MDRSAGQEVLPSPMEERNPWRRTHPQWGGATLAKGWTTSLPARGRGGRPFYAGAASMCAHRIDIPIYYVSLSDIHPKPLSNEYKKASNQSRLLSGKHLDRSSPPFPSSTRVMATIVRAGNPFRHSNGVTKVVKGHFGEFIW